MPPSEVFRFRADVSHFQEILVDMDDDGTRRWRAGLGIDYLDGTPIAQSWTAPPVYAMYPKRPRGDCFYFFGLGPDTLALSERAVSELQDLLWCAELLPVPYGGDLVYVLNPTEVINAVDQDLSIRESDGMIEVPAFVPHRLTEAPLFRLAEPGLVDQMFGTEFEKIRGKSIRWRVAEAKLKGFLFETVWTSEQGVVPGAGRWK